MILWPCYKAVQTKTRDMSGRRQTEEPRGPRHRRRSVRRTARRGSSTWTDAASFHWKKKLCKPLSVSLPSLNIIQSNNLIECDIQLCKFIWFWRKGIVVTCRKDANCCIPKAVQEQLVEHFCRVYEGAYDRLINIQKRISGTNFIIRTMFRDQNLNFYVFLK